MGDVDIAAEPLRFRWLLAMVRRSMQVKKPPIDDGNEDNDDDDERMEGWGMRSDLFLFFEAESNAMGK